MTEMEGEGEPEAEPPSDGGPWSMGGRAGLSALSSIPFAGGLFAAAAGFWSEREQRRMNDFIRGWMKLHEREMRDQANTLKDVADRLDMHDEQIRERVRSEEYQSLVRRAIQNWAGTESAKKREFVRNILSNAAQTAITSDDVLRIFLDWLHQYSEFHFVVIGQIYRVPGSTRGDVWRALGKGEEREDSADADLYKLLFRDLSAGGIVRQHRETDYAGNFVATPRAKSPARGLGSRQLKSAFDNAEPYELTALGAQFVHYAMTDVPVKLAFHDGEENAS